MTDEEFKIKYKSISQRQRNLIRDYLQNGFDEDAALLKNGYVLSYRYSAFRKVNDLIDYLIQKNHIFNQYFRPIKILHEYEKIIKCGTNLQKLNALDKLSKIKKLYDDKSEVKIQNNMPQTPVIIKFEDEND